MWLQKRRSDLGEMYTLSRSHAGRERRYLDDDVGGYGGAEDSRGRP
jgi:hypothetical protein